MMKDALFGYIDENGEILINPKLYPLYAWKSAIEHAMKMARAETLASKFVMTKFLKERKC